MTRAEAIAAEIADKLSGLKTGTLRFWGKWFGRPYDNIHWVVACGAQGNLLQLKFNEGEVLSVWSPQRAEISDKVFRIQDTARVRWQWYSYGAAKVDANRYFEDFIKTAGRVQVATNFDLNTPNLISLSSFNPRLDEAAVEIV